MSAWFTCCACGLTTSNREHATLGHTISSRLPPSRPPTWNALLIALAVWAVSIPLAYAPVERDRRDPAEVLLRRMTSS